MASIIKITIKKIFFLTKSHSPKGLLTSTIAKIYNFRCHIKYDESIFFFVIKINSKQNYSEL